MRQGIESLAAWYEARASAVDQGNQSAAEGLKYAARQEMLALGIDEELGGHGGTLTDMAQVIRIVSGRCLASGFLMWCHRMSCEYIVASGNEFLIKEVLPRLVRVDRFGATGLSNALKHAASFEEIKVRATFQGEEVIVNGGLPWSSNLVGNEFVVTVAAVTDEGKLILIAVPSDAGGVQRGQDYPLTALGGTCSTSVRFNEVRLGREWVLTEDAPTLMPTIHRVFFILQSALALGLAEASFDAFSPNLKGSRQVLTDRAHRLSEEIAGLKQELASLIDIDPWNEATRYRGLRLRKTLAEVAMETVWLELEAMGGAGYMATSATSRRLREAAFLPVLSPSLVQLRHELDLMKSGSGNGIGQQLREGVV